MKEIAAFRLAMIGATLLAATAAHAQGAGAPPQLPLSLSTWQQLQNNPALSSQLGAGLPPVAAEPGPIPAASAPGQAPVVPSWSNLTNTQLGGPYNLSNPLLLTDGTVIVHRTDNPSWWKLTPDINGSYINGTWSQIASLPVINSTQYDPKFFASAVLPDGRVIIEGGEYNNGAQVWTNLGAIYDPIADAWTPLSPPTGWARIGDAQSVVLANGTFMLADCCGSPGNLSALLNPTTLTWTTTGTGKFDLPDEEAWALLASGKVLTVDAYVGTGTCDTNTEIYDPGTGAWTSAGHVPSILSDCNSLNGNNSSFEIGPNVLTYAGTVLAFGGTTSTSVASHMAIYSTGGTWSAGADQPFLCGAGGTQACTMADAPAAVLPNGNVLLAASAGLFTGPTKFFEYSPTGNSYTAVAGTSDAGSSTSFYHNFLVLPTGQILNVSTYNSTIQIYTPTGTYQSSWQPGVTSAPSCVIPGSSYVVSGKQLNGLTQGAYYGDDQQASTNYPLVQIINNSTGHVFYARTSGHSTMSVAPNAAGSTNFKVAAGTEIGASTLYVIATGIPSAGTAVTVASACASLVVTPSTPIASSGDYGGPFSPTTWNYQVSSTSDSVNFSIGGIPSWLNASLTSGTATTSPTTVTFSLMNAGTLHHGTYNATITFTNTTNGQGNTSRTATLIVNPTKDECVPTGSFAAGVISITSPCGIQPPIQVTCDNCTYTISPSSQTCNTISATVTGTKIDLTRVAHISATVVDCFGDSAAIDPIFTTLKLNTGRWVSQTFRNVPKTEHFIDVNNGSPGLTHLSVRINGREYESGNLQANQTAHFDATALMNLEKNSITFVGQGETGSFANIAVSDTAPAVQGRNQNPARIQDVGVWGPLEFSQER